MCLPNCAGCQMCFDDKLTEVYGENWIDSIGFGYAFTQGASVDDEDDEGELPF